MNHRVGIDLSQRATLTFPQNIDQVEAAELVRGVGEYLDRINNTPGSTHVLDVETPSTLVSGQPSFFSEALNISASGADKIHEMLGARATQAECLEYLVSGGATA